MDILVLKQDKDNKITFGFLEPAQYAVGIRKLAQIFLVTFFRIPGTDVFNRSYGGGIGVFVGGNVTEDIAEELRADIAICVRQAEESMFNEAIGKDIPAVEKLKAANMIDFEANDTGDGFTVKVELISQTNELTNISIGL